MDTTRNCMSDRIRRTLTDRILSGDLAPGVRLLEKELAKEFDTSQTPVREALRELETMRLVDSAPYRGTRVRAVSDNEMAEAYTVRAVLEQLAAELAAVQLKGNVACLQKNLADIHAAASRGDQERYSAANLEFHRGIMVAAKNQVLLNVWDSLGFETRMRVMVARHKKELIQLAALHDPIVDALQRGDGKLAGQLLRNHSESFVEENLSARQNSAVKSEDN